MAKRIYKTDYVTTIDGIQIELSPIKIKYIEDFMNNFSKIKDAEDDAETMRMLCECVAIAMKQYCPQFKTVDDVEDNFDLNAIYKIVEIAGNIKMNKKGETITEMTTPEKSDTLTWENFELDKLESEIFVIGAWKNYEELETSLSLPELFATIERIRELDYNEKRFLAAMQGVDLDEQSGKNDKEADPWEAMQARIASNGATSDPNDILSFQGARAAKHGFGIGMGIDYEVL